MRRRSRTAPARGAASRSRSGLASTIGRRVILLAVALATASTGGCGLGGGAGARDVQLEITRDFGARSVRSITRSHVPGAETVMRMLERAVPVTTRYGGGFVESIDGLSGRGSHLDWFYYVNGVEAPVGAASTAVHRGDRIWWDLHDWRATNSVPAVVGSFPEPFVHGVGGKRLPVTLECAPVVPAACKRVASALGAAGVPSASQLLGTGSGPDTLGVVVAPWRALQAEVGGGLIAHGPAASGVYARFAGPGGGSLELLDPAGRVARTLAAGAGLIAATRDNVSEPIWFVTGTDAAGVSAAAAALTAARLRDHFALAVQGGRDVALPVAAR